jgi:hypothetical protein
MASGFVAPHAGIQMLLPADLLRRGICQIQVGNDKSGDAVIVGNIAGLRDQQLQAKLLCMSVVFKC